METAHTIWAVLDDEAVLDPISPRHSFHIKNAMIFEISDDNEDGTYPRVSDYMRMANQLEEEGTSAWLNRLTRKRNKKEIDFMGCKIIRSADYEVRAVIEFNTPIKVVFGRIGDNPVIREVKRIRGEFTHDWYWTRNGRQDKIANGFEIYFNIEEYLE